MLHNRIAMACVLGCFALAACGPRASIPPRPVALPEGVTEINGADSHLAKALAPVLFLQRDEWFPLERVVAVMHPTRPIIAYHLLWRDDVHGSWIPFTIPTDQEVVWVGYDGSGAPTDVWTFWHGTILHTPWRDRGAAAIDVQWGKHGSLPRGTVESDLPAFKTVNAFYLFSWVGVVDMWLGKLTRPGPGCFCKGYDRYREYSRPVLLGDRIDVVVRAEDVKPALKAVFGRKFSNKRAWPDPLRNAQPSNTISPSSLMPSSR